MQGRREGALTHGPHPSLRGATGPHVESGRRILRGTFFARKAYSVAASDGSTLPGEESVFLHRFGSKYISLLGKCIFVDALSLSSAEAVKEWTFTRIFTTIT